MKHILYLALLGILAGSVSGFRTRIIKPGMIFEKIGKRLDQINYRNWIRKTKFSACAIFLNCVFCLQVWIFFLFALFYVIEYQPPFIYAVIGIFGGVGAGNLIAEIIYSLRNGR